MKALYDRHGQVYAWLQKATGLVMDRQGRHVALIRGGNVHDYQGRHLGWWDGDHVRDRSVRELRQEGLGVMVPLPALPIAVTPCVATAFSLPELPPLRPLSSGTTPIATFWPRRRAAPPLSEGRRRHARGDDWSGRTRAPDPRLEKA
jgi:hypothetical protein